MGCGGETSSMSMRAPEWRISLEGSVDRGATSATTTLFENTDIGVGLQRFGASPSVIVVGNGGIMNTKLKSVLVAAASASALLLAGCAAANPSVDPSGEANTPRPTPVQPDPVVVETVDLTPEQTLVALERSSIPPDMFPSPIVSRERWHMNTTPLGYLGSVQIRLDHNSYLDDVNEVNYDVLSDDVYARSFVIERRSNFERHSDDGSIILPVEDIAAGAFCTRDDYEPATCVAPVGHTIVWARAGDSSGFDLAIPMLESAVIYLASLEAVASGPTTPQQSAPEFRNQDITASQIRSLYPERRFTSSTSWGGPVLDSVVDSWNGMDYQNRREWCDFIIADIEAHGAEEAAALGISANQLSASHAAAVEWTMAQWGACAIAYDAAEMTLPAAAYSGA